MRRINRSPPHPLLRKHNSFFLPVLFFLLCLFPSAAVLGEENLKEKVLAQYEKVISLAEELNIYQEDIFQTTPKIRLAVNALLRDDFEQASHVLDEALTELNLLRLKRPTQMNKAVRLEWLQIYSDVIQKYALVAIVAFFIIQIPYFQKMLIANRLSSAGNLYLTILLSSAAILTSLFDLARYGESSWAFLDIQVVFLVIVGLLAGVWPGILAGVIVGVFRWILMPAPVYPVIALGAGLAGGLSSHLVKSYQKSAKIGFVIGFFVGVCHGLAVYIRMIHLLPWYFILLSVAFIALLEGAAVFIFFVMISGILREKSRGEMEQELLKTKLQFLQAQINPHFLYNALNTVSSVCSQENAPRAQNLILRLADFFRGTLKRADDSVTLREEMAHIDSYLDIEKARFEERLRIEKQYNIREALWNIKVPFLIFQPLVENAIKHGVAKKGEGGTVRIHLSESNGSVRIEVQDDGLGIPLQKAEKVLKGSAKEEGGIGIQNIQDRLNRFFGSKCQLQFESKPGEGTKVTVELPIQEIKKSGKAMP